MNILSGYIVKEVLKGSAIAIILLLTLFNLFTFSDELKDLGKGNYGIKEIFLYLAFTSPRVFYELIPSAALLGSLFVVGSMANNREIVAMRAAGASIFWVIKSVMQAGAIIVIIALLVGEFIAPDAERKARILKTTAQNNEIVMHSKSGLWLKEGNQFINVRKIPRKGELADIYIYEVDGHNHLFAVKKIDNATFSENNLWKMTGVIKSEIAASQILSSSFPTQAWNTSIDPDLLNIVVVDSENMSLYDLFMYIDFLKRNDQKTQSFELAFWSRLINPFITFVMLMISIPFVVGVQRGMSTGGRMMIGGIIGMTFNIFDKIAGYVGLVYGYDPMIMAVLPSTIVFLSALYAVKKTVAAS